MDKRNKKLHLSVDSNILLRIIRITKQQNVAKEVFCLRKWLADARKKRKLSHQDVADATKIKRQYYGMIENGERTPSVTVAKKIGEVLGVDWTLFFDHEGNETLQTKIG